MTRLYTPENLFAQQTVSLAEDHVHYLRNVLRSDVGTTVALFNERDGEWLGRISVLTKSRADVLIETCVRKPEPEPNISLIFCPIKHDPQHYLIEKCTEVGVMSFYPVVMDRGNIHKINQEKLQRIAIEASQQCERLSVPTVYSLQKLEDLLAKWPQDHPLYVCAERKGQGELSAFSHNSGDAAALIGPEGGITAKEFDLLAKYPFVKLVGLGKNILRAETAAVVAATRLILG